MKKLFLLFASCIFIFLLASAAWYVSKLHLANIKTSSSSLKMPVADKSIKKINTYAIAAKQFTRENNFNTRFCFLIDMSIESGKNRFFVYDMKADSILTTGLVAHGCCNQNWLTGRKYGNTIGCGCTSLGKYKIANPYYGRFGLAYKLYGLDATNSNAYNRFVVLHSMQCIPENEVYPYPICQSDGCPAVSQVLFKELATFIPGNHPVLLWIFN
jgi:L,D-transpeptidase catalytic domain